MHDLHPRISSSVDAEMMKKFVAYFTIGEWVDLSSGWTASLCGAWNVLGASVDFGGGGSGTWTYLVE